MHSVRKGGTTYAYGALAGDAAHVKIMDLMQAKRLEVRTIHMLRFFMLTHVWLRACLHANLPARPLIYFHSCAQSIALHDSAGLSFMPLSWLEAEGPGHATHLWQNASSLLFVCRVSCCQAGWRQRALRGASASWNTCSSCWPTRSWCRCQVRQSLGFLGLQYDIHRFCRTRRWQRQLERVQTLLTDIPMVPLSGGFCISSIQTLPFDAISTEMHKLDAPEAGARAAAVGGQWSWCRCQVCGSNMLS